MVVVLQPRVQSAFVVESRVLSRKLKWGEGRGMSVTTTEIKGTHSGKGDGEDLTHFGENSDLGQGEPYD